MGHYKNLEAYEDEGNVFRRNGSPRVVEDIYSSLYFSNISQPYTTEKIDISPQRESDDVATEWGFQEQFRWEVRVRSWASRVHLAPSKHISRHCSPNRALSAAPLPIG